MTPAERSAHMRALVRSSGMKRPQVAEALGVSLAAVDSWMQRDTAHAHRAPPAMALKLLESLVKKS